MDYIWRCLEWWGGYGKGLRGTENELPWRGETQNRGRGGSLVLADAACCWCMVCAVAQILLKGQEEVRARRSAPEEKVHSLPVSLVLFVSVTRGSDRSNISADGWPVFCWRLVAWADGWKLEAEGCSTLVYQVHGDMLWALPYRDL